MFGKQRGATRRGVKMSEFKVYRQSPTRSKIEAFNQKLGQTQIEENKKDPL